MFGPKFWLPLGLAIITMIITTAVGIHASVTWFILLLRSFFFSVVMGGCTFALVAYVDHILAEKKISSPGTAQEQVGAGNDSTLDMQIPSVLPFAPSQIEQDLERLLSADPERAAEIIRKMQLDD